MAENSQKKIVDLVDKLPEIYQPIFGYPEISIKASRQCEDRLVEIKKVYELLSVRLGRPLKVLDLGSSQGFFSFSLASLGAFVNGIDFLSENVDVCQEIALKFPTFKVKFETARVEDFVDKIKKDEYDLVLGLSIFHHIIHEHGKDRVNLMIKKIAEKISVGIFEIALAEEPLYWGSSQHRDPRDLLSEYSFVHEISRIKTHLSEITRPLYVASNNFWILNDQIGSFESWKDESHHLAQGIHMFTRRYFFSKEYLIKMYLISNHETIKGIKSKEYENLKEYEKEVRFLGRLKTPFITPRLITFGKNKNEAWLVRESLQGDLLSEVIESKKSYSEAQVLKDVIFQLTELEKIGFYHNDLRTWNVIIGSNGRANLIDYGSISDQPKDCTWPYNLLLSLLIFIHEVLKHEIINPNPIRSPLVSPLDLDEPYKSIFIDIFSRPIEKFSFKYVYEDILKRSKSVNHKDVIPSSVSIIELLQKKTVDLIDQFRHLNLHINSTQSHLDLTKIELKSTKEELNLAKAELDLARVILNSTKLQSSLAIKELDSTKSQLDLKVGELNAIYSCRGWRIVVSLRKVYLLIIPYGSIRRKIVRLVWKAIRNPHEFFIEIARKIKKQTITQSTFDDLDDLSPRARKIYLELKTDIENRKKNK